MTTKQRYLIVTLFAALFSKSICAQETPKWVFYGLLLQENVGCTNPANTRYTFKWIEKNTETYRSEIDTFYNSFKKENAKAAGTYVNQFFELITGKELYIAAVEKHRKCSNGKIINNLDFYKGETLQALKQSIESDLRLYKEIIDYRIVQQWDCFEEYSKLKSSSARFLEVSDDFEGVQVRYIPFEYQKKRAILARFKNTFDNKLAIIIVQVNGKFMVDYVEPGYSLTQKYYGDQLYIQIVYSDYKMPKPSFSVINFVKGFVKKQVTFDNDKVIIKKETTATGVRG